MSKITRKTGVRKPHPDFPLFAHATDRWAKKIRGKLHYFGKVSTDTQGTAALQKWLDEKDDLLAGRVPRTKREGLTIKHLLNHFLTAKQARVRFGRDPLAILG